MKLINKTKDRVVVDDLKKAENFKDKMIGLMKEESPVSLYFQTRWGIHTFGMSFPIDCLVTDDDMTVRVCRSDMEPNEFFLWNPLYGHVFELPAGTIKKNNTAIRDKLIISE